MGNRKKFWRFFLGVPPEVAGASRRGVRKRTGEDAHATRFSYTRSFLGVVPENEVRTPNIIPTESGWLDLYESLRKEWQLTRGDYAGRNARRSCAKTLATIKRLGQGRMALS